MRQWQQYQRLKFEYKERGLPLDGSYVPPEPPGGWGKPPTSPRATGESGLHRTTSTPVLQGQPLPISHAPRQLQRGMSGMLGGKRGSQAWSRAASPSVDLGQASPVLTRPKSGTFNSVEQMQTRERRNSISLGKKEMVKLKSMGDTFEKAKQHVHDGQFDKAIIAYSLVVVETLAQRALCLIQLEDYAEAIVNCDFALHFEPSNGKVLIRKAKALAKLGRPMEAKAARAVASPHLPQNDPEFWEVGDLLGLNNGVPRPNFAIDDEALVQVNEQDNGEVEVSSLNLPPPPDPSMLPPPPDLSNLPPAVDFKSPGRGQVSSPVAQVPSPTGTSRASGSISRGRGSISASPSASSLPPVPGGRGRGTARKSLPQTPPVESTGSPRDPLSPSAVRMANGRPSSGSLKKPASAAPLPPGKPAPKPVVAVDPLDPSLNYAEMEDSELPPLPDEAPPVDEDMERWQQYQVCVQLMIVSCVSLCFSPSHPLSSENSG